MSSQAATLEAACYSFKPTHLCTKHCVGRLEWLGVRGGRMLTTPLGVGAPEVCSFQPTVILQQDTSWHLRCDCFLTCITV